MSRKIQKSKHYLEEGFIETIGEVSENKYESWENNDKLKFIGKPISRIDGYDKVSGTAVYTHDINLQNMAYAKILRCPLPHAKIKKINLQKAQKLEGVLSSSVTSSIGVPISVILSSNSLVIFPTFFSNSFLLIVSIVIYHFP